MQGGWFIGDFEPTVYKTPLFEVAYKTHQMGDPWPRHAQKTATEINLITSGHLRLNGTHYKKGDIIVVEPNEFVTPEFLSDVKVLVVKVPSLPSDKVFK